MEWKITIKYWKYNWLIIYSGKCYLLLRYTSDRICWTCCHPTTMTDSGWGWTSCWTVLQADCCMQSVMVGRRAQRRTGSIMSSSFNHWALGGMPSWQPWQTYSYLSESYHNCHLGIPPFANVISANDWIFVAVNVMCCSDSHQTGST